MTSTFIFEVLASLKRNYIKNDFIGSDPTKTSTTLYKTANQRQSAPHLCTYKKDRLTRKAELNVSSNRAVRLSYAPRYVLARETRWFGKM
jgi:hypothetical protein